MKPGKLIVICGIDGAGKTTLEQGLKNYLKNERHLDVYVTKQPTDDYRNNPTVRSYLDTGNLDVEIETIALLAAADRMVHINRDILPRLKKGEWVICNRYVYSTFAYFDCRGADMAFVNAINSRVRKPDCGFLLTLPSELAVDRVYARDGNARKFEEKNPVYLDQVQKKLQEYVHQDFLTVASDLSVETMLRQCVEHLEKFEL